MLNKLSRILYGSARSTRDLNALYRSFAAGSLRPLIKRFVNKWLGRNIISRLWWR